MKRFSAQYVFTNTGAPLKRAVVSTDNDGTIINVEDTLGLLQESPAIEYHNGIIVPGFVNCHCHLELSHLKGIIYSGGGLGEFIMKVRSVRDTEQEKVKSAIEAADLEMYNNGIVLCADICNTDLTFKRKVSSRIKYLNLLEVFGIDPEKAEKRMSEVLKLADEAKKNNLSHHIVPHSAYSVSLPLFRLIRQHVPEPEISSIHFLETEGEVAFLDGHTGPLRDSYDATGLMPQHPELVPGHAQAILEEMAHTGSLILVHNTFADGSTIKKLRSRSDIFWCLCPGSNLYIEGKLPPADMLAGEGCTMVIGTDSLASNSKLSILAELKTLQKAFPQIKMEDLIKWATSNGASALRQDKMFGSIAPGKRPGLLLLENIDLQNLRLLPETSVKRLI